MAAASAMPGAKPQPDCSTHFDRLSSFEQAPLRLCRQPVVGCLLAYRAMLGNATALMDPCRISKLRSSLCRDAASFLDRLPTPNMSDSWSKNIRELTGHLTHECTAVDEYNMRRWEPALFQWPMRSTRMQEWARRLAAEPTYAERWQRVLEQTIYGPRKVKKEATPHGGLTQLDRVGFVWTLFSLEVSTRVAMDRLRLLLEFGGASA